MEHLLTPEVINALLALTSVTITGFVGWLVPTLRARWGIDIDARARETLHSALHTGAILAWSQVSDKVEQPDMGDLIDILLAHVTGEGAGQAVTRLSVSQTALRSLAEAKLLEIGNQIAPELPTALLGRRD